MHNEVKEFINIRFALDNESDRFCAPLAASKLENELELLLRMKLTGSSKEIDKLFSGF